MKGLLISLIALLAFILTAIVAARLFKPKRHLQLFAPTAALWAIGYVTIFLSTPSHLGFLPSGWQSAHSWVDATYGFFVYWLNVHTVVDIFFATCGGFSVSLLSAILKAPDKATTDCLVSSFSQGQGEDKIYNWRVPHLERQGYLSRNTQSGNYQLTLKGRFIARSTKLLKKLMNLGKGG